MRKVELRMNENKKYEVIKELVDHGGNKTRAATKLNISRRQIDRLINIYKEKGKSGFIHGNRNRRPVKVFDKSLSEDIILLYKNKYYDFNFVHFKEYLEEDENIKVSYKFIYNCLTYEDILSPKARRITRKKHKKKQLEKEKKLNNKTEDEIEVIVNNELALEDSHPRLPKPKYFGEVIEMDGSIHLWFGETKCCLHLAIDKATSTIVGAYFQKQEVLIGYYNVFYQILNNYGIPYNFTTDNRSIFNYLSLNHDKKTSEKDVLTQFGYACDQLGVELKTSSIPQTKALIERTNGTFQGRLVQELRLNNINTIDEANEYLINTFVPKFNKKFALDYKKFKSVMETSPSQEKINYTLAVITERKIDNGNSIKYYNKYYQPYLDGKIKCFSSKTEALVIKAFDGSLVVAINEKVYELKELPRNERFSKEFDVIPKETKEEKIYIPPMTHPWKIDYYKKQIKKARSKWTFA